MPVKTSRFRDRVEVNLSETGVAEVCLVRTDKLNALDADMFTAILEAGEHVAALHDLRAVVLHGAGRAFCAGLDMEGFRSMAGTGSAGQGVADLLSRPDGLANRAQQVVWQWRRLGVPVAAALHGAAFGGGLQLALAADVRFASRSARLSVMEIKWGLVPDMAGMALLRDLVRGDHLREMLYTGRIVDADEAARLGLVTAVVDDPLSRARTFATAVASNSPDATRAAKRLLNMLPDADTGAVLRAEAVEQTALIGSLNQREAAMAVLERRPPAFQAARPA